MRNIFKAKRKDNQEWVEGYYVNCVNPICLQNPSLGKETRHYIFQYPFTVHEIFTGTLCQCTGEYDGDKLIWENDIYSISRKGNTFNCVVEWHDGAFWFVDKHDFENSMTLHDASQDGYVCFKLGNIFDNPELLESEDQDNE